MTCPGHTRDCPCPDCDWYYPPQVRGIPTRLPVSRREAVERPSVPPMRVESRGVSAPTFVMVVVIIFLAAFILGTAL
jgi:hypothetical protein